MGSKTSITVEKDIREQLEEQKRDGESWGALFERLLESSAASDGHMRFEDENGEYIHMHDAGGLSDEDVDRVVAGVAQAIDIPERALIERTVENAVERQMESNARL